MIKKHIPYDFVFDHLVKSQVMVKPMFGFFAIYARNRIVLVLRCREDKIPLNGIWLAVNDEYLTSVKADFPSLVDLPIIEGSKLKKATWLIINELANDFEEIAIRLCKLIEDNDLRVGHAIKIKTNK